MRTLPFASSVFDPRSMLLLYATRLFRHSVKIAKHAAHLRQDLLHFVCLYSIICLYSIFMHTKCIYECKKRPGRALSFMPGIFPGSPPPVPVSAGGWARLSLPLRRAATRWTGPASRTYRRCGAHGPRSEAQAGMDTLTGGWVCQPRA